MLQAESSQQAAPRTHYSPTQLITGDFNISAFKLLKLISFPLQLLYYVSYPQQGSHETIVLLFRDERFSGGKQRQSGSTFRDGVVVYVWFCFGFLPNKCTGFTSNQTISVPESSWGFHLPQFISKHLYIS